MTLTIKKDPAKPDMAIAKQMLFATVIAQCVNSATGEFDKDPAFEGYYQGAGFQTEPIVCIGGVQNDDCCIVSTIDDAIVVAFRGTTKVLSDWLMDAQMRHGHQKDRQKPFKFPGRIHTGFLAAASHVWSHRAFKRAPRVTARIVEWAKPEGKKRVRPAHYAMDEVAKLIKETGFTKVYITGHSKGGAMATLAAWFCYKDLDIVPECYTFASPYPADRNFAAAYNGVINQFTYENYYDIVPLVPPPSPMYIGDLMRLIPGKMMAKAMKSTMHAIASTIKGTRFSKRLFDYVPCGHRFVMRDGKVSEFAAGDFVGKAFEDFRDQRWIDITRRLALTPLDQVGKALGSQHSKRCKCDPLVPSAGVYTALVGAEGQICDSIAKK